MKHVNVPYIAVNVTVTAVIAVSLGQYETLDIHFSKNYVTVGESKN